MVFVRLFVGLLTIVSLSGCTNATPEVTFFSRNKTNTTSALQETIVGSHSASGAGYKIKATARITSTATAQSSNGNIVLKGVVK